MATTLSHATNGRPRRGGTDARRLLDLLNAVGSTTFRQFLWQRASELDLTFAQSQVLFYVAEHRGCPMGDVAKAFGVTLPAVTHIVDRLVQKGLAERGAVPGDRRVCALALTAPGRGLVKELHGLRTRAVEDVLTHLPAEDRQRLLRGLEALVTAARKSGEASA